MSDELAMTEMETFDTDIAVIGMSGRYPKSRNLDEWWDNLRNGTELISFFSEQELLDQGVPPEVLANDHYVRAGSVLEDAAMFDAKFFGFNPREAEIIDPQDRVFLESAHEALEHAGYMAENYNGRIGVYAGESMNLYLLNNIYSNKSVLESVGGYQTMTGNDKDFLPTRVSYKLDLRGPSINVQTACSTSLVAVHMAVQSLLNGECDIALAGGVSVQPPQGFGYMYQEEMILSPDGHCRAFDAQAKGTIAGTGVGIVILKRLGQAIEDGDTIHAVIKGSAINNDGLRKVGYTAPSIEGQAEVIAEAQAMARLTADTITYVEAHGTATPLGDPIEIAALTQAFRATTQEKGYCAIGSVKTNLGHTDAAAGVTGLIKTVLQLKHREIVPSLHFESSNPQIDFASSPFYVNAELKEWKANGTPLRAGVSSFGIGGTNAHVVVEEAPIVKEAAQAKRASQLLTLSAKSETALEAATDDLGAFLQKDGEVNLADLAYTQHAGRTGYDFRRAIVAQSVQDAANALAKREVLSGHKDSLERSVVFMFTGQGSQYVGMGRELYEQEPTFRAEVDRCAEILVPYIGCDLRQLIYCEPGKEEEATERLTQTALTQPALFVIEYALAKLWLEWGVRPAAMIGHSIGEYVAACLAEVMSLEDALKVVAMRGKLMQSLPGGSMLAVPLPESEVESLLGPRLSLATVNAPQLCVVSGESSAIAELEERLSAREVRTRRLHTSHAFHSAMMSDIIAPFTEFMGRISLKPPRIQYISNVTGRWITDAEATDPRYWATHLRQAVRFSDGLRELLVDPRRILLEVGPGQTLSSLAKPQLGQAGRTGEALVLSSLRHAQDEKSDVAFILNSLGRLWVNGTKVDWNGFHKEEKRRRIPIPTYPFERQRYWIEANRQPTDATSSRVVSTAKKQDLADWFYVPSWKRSVVPERSPVVPDQADQRWLIFKDESGIADRLTEELQKGELDFVTVAAGDSYSKTGDSAYTIKASRSEDYVSLIQDLVMSERAPNVILHCWLVDPENPNELSQQDTGYNSLINLTQALVKQMVTHPLQLGVVMSGVQEVIGEETIVPAKALALGACTVIPQEYANIKCRRIDVTTPATAAAQGRLALQLLAEMNNQSEDLIVAYRGNHRWVQIFEATRLEPDTLGSTRLKEGGVYLLTGGLGGIGLVLAEHLASKYKAKLVLTARTALPPRAEWSNWLTTHPETDGTSRKILKVQQIEALGGSVEVCSADVADEQQMRQVISTAREKFGRISGVIHAAGLGTAEMIQQLTPEISQQTLTPKVQGTEILFDLVKDEHLDFMALCSSVAAILGGLALSDYSAANVYLDAFARRQGLPNGTQTVAINWDRWQEVGMASNPENLKDLSPTQQADLNKGIKTEEGLEAFERILRTGLGQVIVSTSDFDAKVMKSVKLKSLDTSNGNGKATETLTYHPRPALRTDYEAPRNDVDRVLIDMWQGLLGIDQVGIKDNFFELGGHSLLATQFISRVRDTFKVELPLRQLFDAGTVGELTDFIVAAEAEPGQIERIAQVMVLVESMSADEVARKLQEHSLVAN